MSDETLNSEAAAAAPDMGATAATDVADTGTPGDEESQETRTFTQEEVNKIAQKEREKSERRIRREFEARALEAQRPANQPPPTRAEFSTDADFVDALTDHKADIKLAQREQQRQQSDAITVYADREEVVREKYSDFQEVVYKTPDMGGPACSDLMFEVYKTSEMGPEMAYYLGKNIEESHRIYQLSPVDQVRELTRLEAKLSTGTATPARKVSSAPDPITPVAGTRATTPKYDTTDPRSIKTMSASEWIEAENNRRRKLAQG